MRSEYEQNLLLVLVLDVLSHLVRYGYYDDIEDVNEMMIPLVELLNGQTDMTSLRKSKSFIFPAKLTSYFDIQYQKYLWILLLSIVERKIFVRIRKSLLLKSSKYFSSIAVITISIQSIGSNGINVPIQVLC